jgi:hypothetical protein
MLPVEGSRSAVRNPSDIRLVAHDLLTLVTHRARISQRVLNRSRLNGVTEGTDMSADLYVQGWRQWDERYADLVIGKRNCSAPSDTDVVPEWRVLTWRNCGSGKEPRGRE